MRYVKISQLLLDTNDLMTRGTQTVGHQHVNLATLIGLPLDEIRGTLPDVRTNSPGARMGLEEGGIGVQDMWEVARWKMCGQDEILFFM